MKTMKSSVVEKLKSSIHLSTFLLFNLSTAFAAPLQWTCDWPEAKPVTFSLYQGETATFEPTFRVNGELVTNATIEAVWYQTNGMGQAWWKLDGNTFAPSNDVGAAAYRFFVEAKVPEPFNLSTFQPFNSTIYRANGALRMLPSPGFTPNALELPVKTLDFAAVEYANAPWPAEIASATNQLDASLSSLVSRSSLAATNYTDAALAAITNDFWTEIHDLDGNLVTVIEEALPELYGMAETNSAAITAAANAATNYTDSATNSLAVGLVEYIESPETVRTNYYTGVSRDTSLRDGKMILYHNQTQATGNWTLDLTLADGTKTGPKPVLIYGSTQAGTYYGMNNIIKLVYCNGTWNASNYFQPNSDTYDRNRMGYLRLAEDVTRNAICCGTTNGYRKVAAGVSFDLSYPLLYMADSTTKAAGSNLNSLFSNFVGINPTYTMSGIGYRFGAPLYLLGSIEGDTFTIGETPLSYEPVRPCIPLGVFSSTQANTFCFLPGPLMRDDVEEVVTNIVRDLSLGGIWDAELEVWWTPRMRNGSLTYEATTNVNLNAEN